MYLNNQFPELRESLSNCNNEEMEVKERIRVQGMTEDVGESRRLTLILEKTEENSSKLRNCILLLYFSIKIPRDLSNNHAAP